MRRIVRTGRRSRVRVASRRPRRAPANSRSQSAPSIAEASGGKNAVTSITLIGSPAWREPMERWLEYESDLTLATVIDPKYRPKHVFDVPKSDVVIAYADARNPDPVVELGLELQAKDRGTGIILVLSGLRDDMARRFSAYAGSWSLITSKTSSDPVQLKFVVQSSARGMPVVEPGVTKLLEAGWKARSSDELGPGPVVSPDFSAADTAA